MRNLVLLISGLFIFTTTSTSWAVTLEDVLRFLKISPAVEEEAEVSPVDSVVEEGDPVTVDDGYVDEFDEFDQTSDGTSDLTVDAVVPGNDASIDDAVADDSATPTVQTAEYCFNITDEVTINMAKQTTLPYSYLYSNQNVVAAMNGVYFGEKGESEGEWKPLGIASVDGQNLATNKDKDIEGYFTVSKDGTSVNVAETLDGDLDDYKAVIGTHPLLVVDGKVHSQADLQRYKRTTPLPYHRSAIGTKDNTDVCFVISTDKCTMIEWAEILQAEGYAGAINLDGAGPQQLAVRDDQGATNSFGNGWMQTRLVITAETPKNDS